LLSVTASFALGLALCATPARASIIYETNAGLNGKDGPVDARATFDFGPNSLTLTLDNLQTNYQAGGQAISGIIFTIGGSPTGTTFTGGTAVHINLDKPGNIVSTSGSATATSRWGLDTTTPVGLTALTGTQPDEMIIGPPVSQTGGSNNLGFYSTSNAQDQFNPFLEKSATFTFTFTGGVTSSTSVSGVKFQFGTGPDTTTGTEDSHIVPPPVAAPEPATLGMAMFAVAASAWYAWRRRRRTAA